MTFERRDRDLDSAPTKTDTDGAASAGVPLGYRRFSGLAPALSAAQLQRRLSRRTQDAAVQRSPADGAPIVPAPVMDITNGQGASVSAQGATAIGDPKVLATEMRPKLEAQAAAAREAYQPLAAQKAKLEDQIAATTDPAALADLKAQKKAVDEKLDPVVLKLKQIDADTKVLDDPTAKPEAFNQILAHQRSGVTIDTSVDVDKHDGEYEKKWSQNKETTVTSSYADGKATKRTDESTAKLGLGTYSQQNSTLKEEVTADGKKSSGETRTSVLSKDGLAYDKSIKQDEEKDGKKSGTEDKTAVKLGPGGASLGETHVKTNPDGSSVTDGKSTGIERGDGKLAGVRSTSHSTKDADGNEESSETKVKGGIIAGKDGVGGFAEAERNYEKKNASGFKTGVVPGLNGNIVCNVEQYGDADPPQYRLVMTVSLGAKLALSAGHEKEEGAGSAGVGVSAEGTVTLAVKKVLSEAETKAYLDQLKAASSGSGGGGDRDLAIIQTGVTKGWDAAQRLYLAAKGGAADPATLAGMKDGESVEVGQSGKVGANANLGAKGDGMPVGVSGGYEVGHSDSMKVEKQDGKFVYTTNQGDSQKLSGGATVGVGPLVSGSMGASHTTTSGTGYKFTINPKDPAAAEMQAALAKCQSQADLDSFAKKYPGAIGEKTRSEGTADAQNGSVSVAGVKAGLNFGSSYDQWVTTDADGKLKSKQMTGANNAGMEVSVGGLKIGASEKQAAAAQVDADGNATVDVSKATAETDKNKWLAAHIPFAGDKKDDKGGSLSKLTGGNKEEADTDTHDVQGMKLRGSDLGRLSYLACNDQSKWMAACPSPSLRDDWAAAGRRIQAAGGGQAATAEALAKFVGGGGGKRDDVIYSAMRDPGDVSGGARYEFPEGLAALKPSYDALVVADSEAALDDIQKKDGGDKAAAKGQEMVQQLDALYASVSSAASKFSAPAVQAEMLAAISQRRDKVQSKLRVLGGGKADALTPKELLAKYNGFVDNCVRYQQTETDCFAKIEATFKDGATPSLDDTIANATLIKQLRDLYGLWNPDYDQMATLAQDNGFGKDNYFKFKPDTARFNRALSGAPGEKSAPQPETADKTTKKKQQEAARAPSDPLGDADRQLEKQRAAQADDLQSRLGPSKNKANGAGNRLLAWIQTEQKPSAVDAHNRGMEKLHSADGNAARMPKNPTPADWESYGFLATQDYGAAAGIFDEGLALYPQGWPPKA